MALVARPTVAPSTPSIPSGHIPSGGRNVASVSFGQIDEISAQTGTHPDANFAFEDFSDWRGRRQPEPEPLQNVGGNFDITSSTFLALMGQEQVDSDPSNPTGRMKGAFQGLLSKAIRAYEGAATTIHGEEKPRGASFSMSL